MIDRMGERIASRMMSPGAWRGLGLLGVLTVVVFWRGIDGKFVTWDDEPLIYANANVANPTLGGLAWHWGHPHHFLYIPVIYTAWWSIARVEMAMGGWAMPLNPAGFHLANLVIHLGSVWMVWWLLSRLVGRGWPAVAGAAIFALHPLQVEPVAWATGMKDVLGGFLSLAAMAVYFSDGGAKNLRWWLATIVFVLALLAKPSAVMVPGIVFVLDGLVFGRSARAALGRLWPWFVLGLGCAVVTKLVQPAGAIDAGPWWTRPWVAADAVGFYLGKLVWPVDLGIDYGRSPGWLMGHHDFWGVTIAFAIAAAVCFGRRAKLTAAALVFVLALLPVLGLLPFDFQSQSTVADRYVYVAMLGPALALALAMEAMPRRAAIAVGTVLVAVWSILSFRQVGVWRDSQALYLHALTVNPRSLTAAQDVAIVYDKSGDELSAIEYYVRAIDIAPGVREEYDNLAMALPRAQRQWPGLAERWAGLHERLAAYYEASGDGEAASAQRAAVSGHGE